MKYDEIFTETIGTLIQTGREDDWWDFKECYHEDKASLLHDIICLANNRANKDAYLIFGVQDKTFNIMGVENDANRKNQQNIVDFLSSKSFAGQLRPRVEVRTVKLSGHEIDVFIIKNSPDVPYYLLENYTDKKYNAVTGKKGKTVFAFHIYTRVMDNNTPIDKSADIYDVEYLWKKRFGLLQTPLEQVKILLTKFDEWIEEEGKYYHSIFPQYTIVLEDEQDVEGICCEGNKMFYHHLQTDTRAYYGTIKIFCYGTQLFSCQLTHLDGHRMTAPCPQSKFISSFKFDETIFLKYYIIDSLEYLLLRFLEHHIGNANGQEAQIATRKLLEVVLLFDKNDDIEDFSEYVNYNLKTFYEIVSKQNEPYIFDETESAKKVIKKEIRESYALKEFQNKWKQIRF